MAFIVGLIALAGHIALLLWGTRMVQTGIQRAFGPDREGTEAHFKRLRQGGIEAVETSSLHLDLLRDLKQINWHLVAAAAYPVLEERGELLRSRTIKPDGRPVVETNA
ncbi:hypothetical protein SAMN05216228_104521 [Rhizobium tibeticum]|uniref:Uncharacterized protein n=1 Tax=Rhizobium tibeticum TaxID=501024 RepID=A0A1H8VPC9_9HYPH|nr:hypothetical protein RTCCBAU85039_6089 [Rhizobium tibeticum]SEP17150.1 hypothetical protein SAMN05216228_104521 [Rhizobium tibeticum]